MTRTLDSADTPARSGVMFSGELVSDAKSGKAAAQGKNKIVLDMGEGSREQGFRINGCR